MSLARVDDVYKRFGDVEAVRGVTLSVEAGEVVGLLGANGAGKTTVIRCLLGLTTPTSGTVSVMGSAPGREVLRRVGYVPQGLGLYTDLTLAENLSFRRGVFRVGTPTGAADLGDLDASVPVGQLPLGLQRRASFTAALSHQPELLVLDEPTSGVGVLGRARLWDTIREAAERGVGALVTTHHLEEAEQCDRLVMLAGGTVVAEGRVDDIIGGRVAVVVDGSDPVLSFDRLASAGFAPSLSGNSVRVAHARLHDVRDALADLEGVNARLSPATLEEAFVDLVRA